MPELRIVGDERMMTDITGGDSILPCEVMSYELLVASPVRQQRCCCVPSRAAAHGLGRLETVGE